MPRGTWSLRGQEVNFDGLLSDDTFGRDVCRSVLFVEPRRAVVFSFCVLHSLVMLASTSVCVQGGLALVSLTACAQLCQALEKQDW